MPDFLTHYSISLLIGYKPLGLKNALLFALVGLLPDIDALFRVHRWFTHSFVFFGIAAVALFLLVKMVKPSAGKYVALGALLYGLHIVMDLFNASTPILYPLSKQALWVKANLDAFMGSTVGLRGGLSLEWAPAEFGPKGMLEGPLVSDVGLAVALGVFVFLALDWMGKKGFKW